MGLRFVAELVFDEVLGGDVHGIVREQRALHRETGREIRIRVVDPTHEMNSSLEFHPEAVRRFIAHGHARAAEVLGGAPKQPPPHPSAARGPRSGWSSSPRTRWASASRTIARSEA